MRLIKRDMIVVFVSLIMIISLGVNAWKADNISTFWECTIPALAICIIVGLLLIGILRVLYKLFNYKIFQLYIQFTLIIFLISIIFLCLLLFVANDYDDVFMGLWACFGACGGIHFGRKRALKILLCNH